MDVLVGSNNEPKRRACQIAFAKVYPQEDIHVGTIKAESGVSDHPTSAEESIRGARNRASYAQRRGQGADYYVGIEGGLMVVEDRVLELGWVVVRNSVGQEGVSVSAGLELRGGILDAVLGGQPLSDAVQDKVGIVNIGDKDGFYGLATNNQVTREHAYVDAIVFALAPFLHTEYFE